MRDDQMKSGKMSYIFSVAIPGLRQTISRASLFLMISLFLLIAVAKAQVPTPRVPRETAPESSTASVSADRSVVERRVEVETAQKNPMLARKELLDRASSKVAEDLIRELIGEAQFQRNRTTIVQQVLPLASRFTPTSKAGELEAVVAPAVGFRLSVLVQVNVDDLQSVLLEKGLFYSKDDLPTILPVVRWVDKVNGESFAWWEGKDRSEMLARMSRQAEERWSQALYASQSYLVRPQAFRYGSLVPESLSSGDFRLSSWLGFLRQLDVRMVMAGKVEITKGTRNTQVLHLSLQVIQVDNGRVLAQMLRKIETDVGSFSVTVERGFRQLMDSSSAELGTQLLEAWARGTLGSSAFLMSFRSDSLNPLDREKLKDLVRTQIRQIKTIRERSISGNQTIYEVEAGIPPAEMAERAKQIDGPRSRFVLERVEAGQLSYRAL